LFFDKFERAAKILPFYKKRKTGTGENYVSEFLENVDYREVPATHSLKSTRNNGIMEWWNNEIIAFHAIICQYPNSPIPHYSNFPNPTFQYSNIPSFQSIVSAAN
jgi:hypothetical protein